MKLQRADDYVFRAPTADDVEYLAANIRKADADEVLAWSGRSDVAVILHESIATSPLCVAVEKRGQLLCIGGAAYRSLLSSTGVPWMLGTHALSNESRLFVQHGRRCVEELLTRFDRLENYVDARNSKSIRWLRRIGFTVYDPEPCGHGRLPFHRFCAGDP